MRTNIPREMHLGFWKGRTKIAPGALRARARRNNKRHRGPGIDRVGWVDEVTKHEGVFVWRVQHARYRSPR